MPSEDDDVETRDTLTQFEDFVTESVLEHLTPTMESDDVDPAAG